MTEEIIIKPSFDFKTVFKANLYMSFNRLASKILVVFAALFIISILLAYFVIEGGFKNEVISSLIESPILYMFLLYPFLLTYLTYHITKKSLKNYRLSEDIKQTFNNAFFQEKGQSFDIKHNWNKLLKVKKKKDYFLIYQAKSRANIIPKQSFKKEQLLILDT